MIAIFVYFVYILIFLCNDCLNADYFYLHTHTFTVRKDEQREALSVMDYEEELEE